MDYEYRGYRISHLLIDDVNEMICGRVLLDRTIVAFEGATPSEFFREFKVAVDHYLSSCESFGIDPEPPPSHLTVEAAVGDPKEAASQAVRELMIQLRTRRDEMGLSPADVSEAMGLDRSALDKLEHGADRNPTIDILFRYAAALGLTIEMTPKAIPSKAKDRQPKSSKAGKTAKTTKQVTSEAG